MAIFNSYVTNNQRVIPRSQVSNPFGPCGILPIIILGDTLTISKKSWKKRTCFLGIFQPNVSEFIGFMGNIPHLFCLAMLQLRTTLSGNPTVKACTVAGCALLLSNGAKSVQPTSSRHGRLGRLMDMTSKRIEME